MGIKKGGDSRPGGSGAAAAAAQKLQGATARGVTTTTTITTTGDNNYNNSTPTTTTSSNTNNNNGGRGVRTDNTANNIKEDTLSRISPPSRGNHTASASEDVEALLSYTPEERHSLAVLYAEFSQPKLSCEKGDQLWLDHLGNVVRMTEKVLKLAAEYYNPAGALSEHGMSRDPATGLNTGGSGGGGGGASTCSNTSIGKIGSISLHTSGAGGNGLGNGFSSGGGGGKQAWGSFSNTPFSNGVLNANSDNNNNSTSSNNSFGGANRSVSSMEDGGGGGLGLGGVGGIGGISSSRAYSFASFMSIVGPNEWNGDLTSGGDDLRTAEEKKADFLAENRYILSQLQQLLWCPFTALRLVEVLRNPLQYHSVRPAFLTHSPPPAAISPGEAERGGNPLEDVLVRGTKLQETIRRCTLVTGGFYSTNDEEKGS